MKSLTLFRFSSLCIDIFIRNMFGLVWSHTNPCQRMCFMKAGAGQVLTHPKSSLPFVLQFFCRDQIQWNPVPSCTPWYNSTHRYVDIEYIITSHGIFILCISDKLAHVVIPLHPSLKPHARMLHHFRFLKPLLPIDEDGMSPLHYYDSAIQLARNSARALSEEEFETGMNAVQQIEKWLVRVFNSWVFCQLFL